MELKKFLEFLTKFKKVYFFILTVLIMRSSFTFACSWEPACDNFECSSVFDPEFIEKPQLVPFFLSETTFYILGDVESDKMRDLSSKKIKRLNAEEWNKFFEGQLTDSLLENLVMGLPLVQLDELIFSLKDKIKPKSPNVLKLYLQLINNPNQALLKHALYYLGFAKRVEPLAMKNDDFNNWGIPIAEKNPAQTSLDIDKMIEAAEVSMKGQTNKFLLARYRFQILRLYFYSKRFDDVVKYFDEHLADYLGAGSIEYRSYEFVAGSLFKSKKFARANSIYALLFDKFPALRLEAWVDFHPQEETDWNETLKMAKIPREQMILWLLLGLKVDGARALTKIIEIDPHFDFLPLLLVREVNKVEQAVGLDNLLLKNTKNDKKISKVNEATLSALKNAFEGGKVGPLGIWALALAHVYAFNEDEKNFSKFLAEAKKNKLKSAGFENQLRMTEFFGRILFLKGPPENDVHYFAKEFTWLLASKKIRMTTLREWSQKKMSDLYEKKGDWIRQFAWKNEAQNPIYRNNVKVDELLTFLTTKASGSQASLDEFVKKIYPSSKLDLQKLMAINLTYADKLEDVFAIYKSNVALGAEKLLANPFKERINDCHDCDFEEVKDNRPYTRLSFIKKMLELKKLSEGQGEVAAKANFELGTAFYNLTYFGNARDYSMTKESNIPERSFSGTLSENYYNQALVKSTTDEMRAKITFMKAKIDHNNIYNSFFDKDLDLLYQVFTPSPAFKVLKEKFSGTQYYQEILKECGYFGKYVKGKSLP